MEVLLAYIFIIFFVILPVVVKVKLCLDKYKDGAECDLEAGIYRSSSQVTLRVPENGGVE